jgi:FAD/FMN-containing dehydrogenase
MSRTKKPRPPTRREFIKLGCAAAVSPVIARRVRGDGVRPQVNDVHSGLNATTVEKIVRPSDVPELKRAILEARRNRGSVAVSGSRHSMGGQQFATSSTLLDMRGLDRIRSFDRDRGVLDVEAGIEWPSLLNYLWTTQDPATAQWGILQKQTGADRLSLGGALASNVHGRGLTLKPIIDQVESFELMDSRGELVNCSRAENPELFRLVIGGYGLFGVVTAVRLRLARRRKVERVVERRDLEYVMPSFGQRIAQGYLYGDFQYATESLLDSFLRRGVFSCYRPVPDDTPLTANPTRFNPEDWARLTYYSHKYKRRAFETYSKRYLQTSGQVYWSDSQLSAAYVGGYHKELDRKLHAKHRGSEMITEIYVPRRRLLQFAEEARSELRARKANVIYGTIRLIERDTESFLAWAREPWVCVIFNLHIDHTEREIEDAAASFRALIDCAIRQGGSYYLTYHRWATRPQVEACYPQMREFLALKRKYDPDELFQSDWYRHYKAMFAG